MVRRKWSHAHDISQKVALAPSESRFCRLQVMSTCTRRPYPSARSIEETSGDHKGLIQPVGQDADQFITTLGSPTNTMDVPSGRKWPSLSLLLYHGSGCTYMSVSSWVCWLKVGLPVTLVYVEHRWCDLNGPTHTILSQKSDLYAIGSHCGPSAARPHTQHGHIQVRDQLGRPRGITKG